MKLKLDEKGNVVIKDGMPVYVYEDGKEAPFDAVAAMSKITELNSESAKHRHEAKEFKEKLTVFEGLNPAEARKALELMANLDTKKLIDAGEVDKVKESVGKAFEEKISTLKNSYETAVKDLTSKVEQKDNTIFKLMVTNKFGNSKFVQEKLTIPADFAEARFGKSFKIEDEKVIAYDSTGKPISSRIKLGEVADFDEALEVLVGEYSDKSKILKGSGAQGSGMQPSGQGGQGGSFILTASQAKDTTVYAKTKEAAAKAGQQIQIISD